MKQLSMTVALALILLGDRGAIAQCPPEGSNCYKLFHYSYQGGTYCRRYYTGSTRFYGEVGSTQGLDQSQINQMVFDNWLEWYFNSPLRVTIEGAGTDTSDSNIRLAVIDNTQFTNQWGSGVLAVTIPKVFPDGTIKYTRTYIHNDVGAPWDWQGDCTTFPCVDGLDFDMPGVLTHEMGHWWALDDVGPPADIALCEYPTMWYQAINSGTFQRDLANSDIAGIGALYDTPTAVGYPLTVSAGPAADTLRWTESDPSSYHQYTVAASDACWGPFGTIASFVSGDPAVTTDGTNYSYVAPAPYDRPYWYELAVSGNAALTYAASTRTQGTPPTPPTAPGAPTAAVTAISGGGAHIEVNWAASSGTVDGYYLYRHWLHLTSCSVRNVAPWDVLGPVTTPSYTDLTPPTGGDSIFYRVRAVNATGGSGLSAEVGVYVGELLAVGDEAGPVNSGPRLVWPNPSTGTVHMAYGLRSPAHVRLVVLDIAGRQVATISDGWQSAGEHRAVWRGEATQGLSPSVYFLRFLIDGRPIGEQRVAILR